MPKNKLIHKHICIYINMREHSCIKNRRNLQKSHFQKTKNTLEMFYLIPNALVKMAKSVYWHSDCIWKKLIKVLFSPSS